MPVPDEEAFGRVVSSTALSYFQTDRFVIFALSFDLKLWEHESKLVLFCQALVQCSTNRS